MANLFLVRELHDNSQDSEAFRTLHDIRQLVELVTFSLGDDVHGRNSKLYVKAKFIDLMMEKALLGY